jgi:hypothetical protein
MRSTVNELYCKFVLFYLTNCEDLLLVAFIRVFRRNMPLSIRVVWLRCEQMCGPNVGEQRYGRQVQWSRTKAFVFGSV